MDEELLRPFLEQAGLSGNVRQTLITELHRLLPPVEFLARGHEFVSTPNCKLFCSVGEQSACKTLGQRFGSAGSEAAWRHFAAHPERVEELGRRLIQDLPDELPEASTKKQIARLAVGKRKLLDPDQPYRWWTLRAIAYLIHVRAATLTSEDHLSRCWAW